MDVLDIFVITEHHVYHTHMYVMGTHIVLMDLMKDFVVRHSHVHVNTLYLIKHMYFIMYKMFVLRMYYTCNI